MFPIKSISRIFSILIVIAFILSLTPLQSVQAASVRFVMPAASGSGDCSSWANACTLQTALTGSTTGDEIWAAAGTYKPTTGTSRTATFQLVSGVAVYGGFAGTELTRDQRNPATNLTTLSGDIGIPTNTSDNSYHVVTGANGATLDGFTITAGNANSAGSPYNRGGGMYSFSSNPTLSNVIFYSNSATSYGGGVYIDTSSPTFTDVTFSGNSAAYGGGICNTSSDPTLTNVTFSVNTATQGGGMINYSSSPTLTNITFSANTATLGGGMLNNSSTPTLTNVTFSGNTATTYGGGMYNSISSSPLIRNTIFWGDIAASGGAQIYNSVASATPTLSFSVVQGNCPAGSTCDNIIITDPLLGTLGNYGGSTQTISLLAGSSAIDTGDNSVCPATDQRGVIRPQGLKCDIGAYEVDTTAPTVLSITRFSANPTNLASLDFTVTFSEPVTGVDMSDFSLTTTGVSGASVTGVTGAGSIYTVTVNTGSGNGTIRLDVPASATITDLGLNPLAGLPYAAGETYTIIKTYNIFLPIILH